MGLRKSILAFKPFCGNFSSVFSASKLRFTEPGIPEFLHCPAAVRLLCVPLPVVQTSRSTLWHNKHPRAQGPWHLAQPFISLFIGEWQAWRWYWLSVWVQKLLMKLDHRPQSWGADFSRLDVELQVQNRLKTADWVSWCFMCLPNIWHRQPSPMRKSWPTNRGSMSVTVGWESLTKGSFAKGSYNSSHGANLDFLACLNFN